MVGEGVEPKICSIDDAMKIANNLGLDLVEISPNVDPPVCKVIDYKKFIYDQKKKQKAILTLQFVKLLIIKSSFTTKRKNKKR